MPEITLPRWIVTQMCMPHGIRMSKRPKPEIVEQVPVHYGFSHPIPKCYYPPEIPGLFEAWEYRFWAASLENPFAPVMECRACHKMYGKEQERKAHPNDHECYRRLCAAYKLLLKDKRCLICNSKTLSQKWGVPLCGSGCQQAWCEIEAQPDALSLALDLVGDNP